MDKKAQINFWYVIAAVAAMLLLQYLYVQSMQVAEIPYSQFRQLLDDGQVLEVGVGQTYIEGVLREPLPDGQTRFITTRVEPELADELQSYNVTFTGLIESSFWRDLLSWVVPALVFFGIWAFIIRRFADRQGLGGLMPIGKSKAKVFVEKDIKVTFDDVAGVDEARAELQEVVGFLKKPGEYGRLGGRVPRGILLVGPPGTGKTLLARAAAGTAGVPFFSINGSEFVELFVGVGAARVRDLFEQARKSAPCIIFIDELDALGRARGIGPMGGGYDEKEQTLNQLLAELDGFDPTKGVILLAATNRPEILDPALLRAGRFDRQILVDRPDKKGRVDILKVHLRKVTLARDIDPDQIAALTPGFTGADLANLVNEAAIVATRRNAAAIEMSDFTAAVERIIAGLEKKSRVLNPKERRVVAYHEMGHALVALALPGTDPVHKVSIIPRGIGALGYTIQRPVEDRFLMTRDELRNKMAVLLGGRAAETIVFDEVSSGAADDLDKVTDIARTMVTRFGMDEKLGQIAYEPAPSPFLGPMAALGQPRRGYSEETAREIDCAVRALVAEAFARASAILKTNRAQLDDGATRLLAKETLMQNELPVPIPEQAVPQAAQ